MDQDPRMGIIRVELNHMNKGTTRMLDNTIRIFRDAVSFLVHAASDHVSDIRLLSSRDETTYMDKLVHHTTDNPNPEYPTFDLIFNRFPSYLRRSANHAACGYVRSYASNCDRYKKDQEYHIKRKHHYTQKAPGFTFTPNRCPTLYKKENYRIDSGKHTRVWIKVWKNHAWQWIQVGMPNRDAKRLETASKRGKIKNPSLIHAYGKYYLVFPVKYKSTAFPKTPIERQKVLGVDLGLTNSAVCSVVAADGSIHGRYFAPFKAEMARIQHLIKLIRKQSSMSGKGQSLASVYTKLQGHKENYTRQLARWIVNTAIDNHVYGIVLEHLSNMRGKSKGSLSERVQHWCTAKIRDYIKGMAFRAGIRVFIINPKGTSRYAYDGSGPVVRSNKNYSLCTFANGKRYNCDLAASYNIGSRYFLRAIKKATPETEWSQAVAKVPSLAKRTEWTLDTLRAISKAL